MANPRSIQCPKCHGSGFVDCECSECWDSHMRTCSLCLHGWVTQREADEFAAERAEIETPTNDDIPY